MQKILIIIDKLGWAYDAIAKGIVAYAANKNLSFDIVSVKEGRDFIEQNHNRYDLIFALGWTLLIAKNKKDNYRDELAFLERDKLITGIHSHRAWDNYLSMPGYFPQPPQELIDKLAKFKGINIISRRLFNIFQDAGLTNIVLTENGVDTELFQPTHPINTDHAQSLVIGFSGSKDIAKHDALKGFSEFILPLKQIPNVEVLVLGGTGEQQVKREDMPPLYNQIDLYMCASTSEGFSQSVLEASACGRGIISTKVGGCEDLIEENNNGFFINRDSAEIKKLIIRLEADRYLVKKLGENNREKILEKYAWKICVQKWLAFIESNLPCYELTQKP